MGAGETTWGWQSGPSESSMGWQGERESEAGTGNRARSKTGTVRFDACVSSPELNSTLTGLNESHMHRKLARSPGGTFGMPAHHHHPPPGFPKPVWLPGKRIAEMPTWRAAYTDNQNHSENFHPVEPPEQHSQVSRGRLLGWGGAGVQCGSPGSLYS